ncbi:MULTISPECIES: large conductance mechanosensitive channel protein MscL [Streptomyces]|uniref:Large conductance mechanosensitive channel protein MscL n=1 Tax=Streptomyces solicathayae TaxID=3081768 RepID=A0ABZ0LVD7_9ACTN|nr:large conductance mechanosensitive channel protein MscL [Streptomyces sp. HUAS YS2]WOX22738.1 large conductance mechanosensitive channel protein MscL [Streptomyces sp. HUAS YS2]
MLNGFKDFILRGNVVSMAIGLAVGSAFTAVVTGFSKAFITPLIGLATGSVGDFSEAKFHVGKTIFPYGLAISAAIAFVITAAVLYFCIVVPMTKVQERFAKEEAKDVKSEKRDCPACFSEIPAIATRCAHCTSEVEPVASALEAVGLEKTPVPAQR